MLSFHYIFSLKDGSKKEFDVTLSREDLSLIAKPPDPPPAWAKLTHCQCPNCPLDASKNEYCPVALHLSEVLDFFKGSLSFEKADVTIKTEGRSYFKETSLQGGLSSLMGIYMASSGCPILNRLRPMVRHHLPFANTEETQYRVLSMYLLAQYFLQKKGKKPDWEFKELRRMYDDIHQVNKAFCNRLKSLEGKDSVPNAVVILDTFANSITFAIDENVLGKIEQLFQAYFESPSFI